MTDIQPAEHHARRHLHTVPPSRAYPIALAGVGTQQLIQGAGLWTGECVEETTGLAIARAVLLDGPDAARAAWSAPLTFSAQQSRLDYFPGPGIVFERGLTLNVTAGAIGGVIFAVLLTRDELEIVQASREGFG